MNIRLLFFLTGLIVALPQAGAANTPMTKYLSLDRTDYAVAGIGGIGAPLLQGGGEGSMHLAGVSGTITLALLYWNGIDIEYPLAGLTGGDGDYDQPQITFDGGEITGTRIAASGNNDCWPSQDSMLPPSAATYRADVTEQVRAHGNGDYAFSGLTSKPGHSANGLSLIVYFDDGNPVNDLRIAHYEGQQSNTETARFAFETDYAGGSVEAVLHVSDGQGILTDGSLTWKTLPGRPDQNVANTLKFFRVHDGGNLWPGNSVPNMHHQRSSPDTLWDIRRMALTPLFGPPHHYTTSFDYPESGQDCISVHVVQIVQPADPQAPMLAPNPFDFGDVIAATSSPVQQFTFTNLMPGPVNVQQPTLADTQFHIAAQTCSGQTLPVGASCTIDMTFAPTVAQPALRRTAALLVPFKDVVFTPNAVTPYVELHGTAIPDAPFSRLSFEPRTCTFNATPVGNSTAPIRFNVRSSGSLPLTIDSVAAAPPQFPLLATTCTNGLNLPSGSACTLDIAFQPLVSDIQLNTSARIGYHASDAPGNNAVTLPLSGMGTTGADAVFSDGFETALCTD